MLIRPSRCVLSRLIPLWLACFIPVASATTAVADERKCMKDMEVLLSQQQIIFSDSQTKPEVRRLAERAIDVSRRAFNKNSSYCEARTALLSMNPAEENVRQLKKGEINYFGRSML